MGGEGLVVGQTIAVHRHGAVWIGTASPRRVTEWREGELGVELSALQWVEALQAWIHDFQQEAAASGGAEGEAEYRGCNVVNPQHARLAIYKWSCCINGPNKPERY